MKKRLLLLSLVTVLVGFGQMYGQTNLIAGWNGNGVTGDASKPNDVGWTNSVTASIPWTIANGSSGCRFRDYNVTGGHTGFTNEVGGSTSQTRQLMFRWDNAAYSASYYGYPVALQSGKYYTFSFDFVLGGSGTPPNNIIVGISTTLNGADRLSSKTFTSTSSATVYRNGTYDFNVPTNGNYYITFNSVAAVWYGVTNLSIVEKTVVDKTALQVLTDSAVVIKNAAAPVGTSTVYTDLQTAITNSQAVIANLNATIAQVVDQELAIKAAITNTHNAINLYARTSTWTKFPYNATSVIVNPSFEATDFVSGWSNPNSFAKATSGAIGSYKGGTNFIEKWVSSPGTQANLNISQVISNLPNGIYTITAAAQAIQQTNPATYPGQAYVYANADSTEVFEINNYTVRTMVTNNTLKIGFAVKTTGNWVALDNFRLTYLGSTIKSALGTLLDSANVMIANPVNVGTSTVYSGLTTAVSAAQAVYNNASATLEEILAQETALSTAITNVNNAILLQTRKDTWTAFPVDATAAIVNPSFEVNGTSGWTNVGGMLMQNNTSFAPKAGTYYVERWKESGNWTGLKLSQVVKYIPNGEYTLTVGALNNPNTTGGVYVYANNQRVEVFETQDYSLNVTVTNNEVEIGFDVVNGGNYVAVDNFRLTFVSAALGTSTNDLKSDDAMNAYMADDRIAVNFNLAKASTVEFSVFNLQGMLISTEKASYTAGKNNAVINANIPSGVYLVKMSSNGKSVTAKVIK